MGENNLCSLHNAENCEICLKLAETNAELLLHWPPPGIQNEIQTTEDDDELIRQKELLRFRDLVARDEWWNWPEAVAWIGTRDLMKVAELRHSDTVSSQFGDYRGNVALGAQQLLVSSWCGSWRLEEDKLHRAIEQGIVRTIGRKSQNGPAYNLDKEIWRGGMIIYSGDKATLVSAKSKASVWAFDIAVYRTNLMEEFPPHDPTQRDDAAVDGTPMTDAELETWCRDWLAGGHGNAKPHSGEDKAWDAFKILPRAQGLSRDDVFRPAFRRAKTTIKQ